MLHRTNMGFVMSDADELRELFGTDKLAESLENVDPEEVKILFDYFKSQVGVRPRGIEKWWDDEDLPTMH